jgi:hypothetical protein
MKTIRPGSKTQNGMRAGNRFTALETRQRCNNFKLVLLSEKQSW